MTVKNGKCLALLGVSLVAMTAQATVDGYQYALPKITDVTISGGFWLPRVETNRLVTLRTNFKKCEVTRIPNIKSAAKREWNTFRGIPYDDSDVFKVIEGAAYILATHPDAELKKYVDDLIGWIAKAQEPDGYLYTARTLGYRRAQMTGPTRWSNCRASHELYNVGHLYEAAVAYYAATGERTLLDVAVKSADLIDRTFGPGATQLKDAPGHQEIELALCRLADATGNKRYVDLARHFLASRGRGVKSESGKVFLPDGRLVDAGIAPGAYNQNHQPVECQQEAVGHAVRATYLYCGMADVAQRLQDGAYQKALDALWQNVAGKKLHLTGSVGGRPRGESFAGNYELPNEKAYLETCAGIGNALWNVRLFRASGDSKYMDIVERALYNGILSGVSISGDEFFYPNPLASSGGYRRSKWFGTSCCPVNVVRFIPQVGQFAYAVRGKTAYVNLFIESDVKLALSCGEVKLSQKTDYPMSGNVRIRVTPPADGVTFALTIRIPGWCVGRPVPSDLYQQTVPGTAADFRVAVNGQTAEPSRKMGYAVIDRAWAKDDVVEIFMNMPVRRLMAHEKVEADRGRLAVERGPIVYCAEGFDNACSAFHAAIPADATFTESKIAICGQEFVSLTSSNGVTLIPYCAWGNRRPGNDMQTWFLPTAPEIAVKASHCFDNDSPDAVIDGVRPTSSDDHSIKRLTFWPRRGTKEWVQLDLTTGREVKGVEVYWFDDTGRGDCRLPESWNVQWRPAPDAPWQDIGAAGKVAKDSFCALDFPSAIKPQAIRIRTKLQPNYSAGILECRLK
jgi:DUF1680 family protein